MLLLIAILFVLKGCSLNVVNKLLMSDVWCLLIVFTWPAREGWTRRRKARKRRTRIISFRQ